jgi:hypothetical protein
VSALVVVSSGIRRSELEPLGSDDHPPPRGFEAFLETMPDLSRDLALRQRRRSWHCQRSPKEPDVFNFDCDALGRLILLILCHAARHSRRWIAVWLASILVLTGVAAVSHAPAIAYVILLVVIAVAVFADGESDESS